MTRKQKLEQSLDIALGLNRIATSTDFEKYLRPHLQKLGTIFPIDRTAYTSEEEYVAALKHNNDISSVYLGLLKFLDSQEAMINKIRQELEKPETSHGI